MIRAIRRDIAFCSQRSHIGLYPHWDQETRCLTWFLAAYATGQMSGFAAIRDAWLASPEISAPDPSTRRTYDDLYRLYCHLDGSIANAVAMLPTAAGANER